MALGLDIGTMFLVKSAPDDIADGVVCTVQRNCFLKASTDSDTEETLSENNWSYAKHEDNYYILGEDAIKLKNLLSVKSSPENDSMIMTKVGDLRRPMKDGILNTAEEKLSIAIIQKLIANLVGTPTKEKETLCFCAPGDPVDRNFSALFHKSMLTGFLSQLGYNVECIPEALAIIFSENPTAEDPDEENGVATFTGIAFSFGAGMANVCFSRKKLPVINFSVARSGDWIDREAAKTSGVDVAAMTRYKEKNLDLENIDYSDMRQAALDIYYQNMIEHALRNFAEKFNQLGEDQIDTPLEIVIAGGTASVKGFLGKFEKVLASLDLPFKVKGVRMASNPLYAVSYGCLKKAHATEKNANKGKSDAPVEQKVSKEVDEPKESESKDTKPTVNTTRINLRK